MVHSSMLTQENPSSAQGQSSGIQTSSTTAQLASTSREHAFSQERDASSHVPNVTSQLSGPSTQVQGVPAQNLQQQTQNSGTHSSRTHKTHLLHVMDKLKSLPLKLRLSMNKDIEQQNDQRALRAYSHALDLGSEAASLITISSAEILSLQIPSVMSTVSSVMPLYLLCLIGLKDQNKDKRTQDNDPNYSAESSVDTHIAKRRCMDGSKLIPRSAANAVEIVFPQILFDTEFEVAVPLLFHPFQSSLYHRPYFHPPNQEGQWKIRWQERSCYY